MVAHGFDRCLETKRASESTGDPITDLEAGWDTHVAFGLEHPAFYTLVYGRPKRQTTPSAAVEALNSLIELLQRAADEQRTHLPPQLATDIVLAANIGVTLTLIAATESGKGADLTHSDHFRRAIIAQLTSDGRER